MYKVVINNNEWDRWNDYVRVCPDEIACFGLVSVDHENELFVVDELLLVTQEVTPSSVEFIDKGLPEAIQWAVSKGRIEDLRFCIHSHVNMGVFWSGDDKDMIAKMGKTGTPWFLSAVSNKKGEHKGRFDLFEIGEWGRRHVVFDDLDVVTWQVDVPKQITMSKTYDRGTIRAIIDALTKKLDDPVNDEPIVKEIESKVSKPAKKQVTSGNPTQGGKQKTTSNGSGPGGKKYRKGDAAYHGPEFKGYTDHAIVNHAKRENWDWVETDNVVYFMEYDTSTVMHSRPMSDVLEQRLSEWLDEIVASLDTPVSA